MRERLLLYSIRIVEMGLNITLARDGQAIECGFYRQNSDFLV